MASFCSYIVGGDGAGTRDSPPRFAAEEQREKITISDCFYDFRICESDITSIYVDGSCWEFRVNEDHGTIVDMNHEETISAEWRSEKMAVPEWPQLFARKYNNSG